MTPDIIKTALDDLATRDAQLAHGLELVGYPEPRIREPGFGALLGIVVGQQVSAVAAAAIRARLERTVDPLTPANFLAQDDATLRAVGLSGRKIEYGRGLAEAMEAGRFDCPGLAGCTDETAIAAITALRGFGRWSAEIYLLFALHRCDVWPAEDLAIREALKRLKGLDERPDRAVSEAVVEPWRPWRGVAALFLWHYYKGAP